MAIAKDTALSRAATFKASDAFFDKLKGKAHEIVSEESQKMASTMEYILRHRQQFKFVGGQFPRWDPSYINPNQTRPKSNRSFDMWTVQKRSNEEYWLINNMRPEGNFNYVRALLLGGPWNTTRPRTERLVPYKGGLYSYQMPQGLKPWIAIKKQDLTDNIKTRMLKELK